MRKNLTRSFAAVAVLTVAVGSLATGLSGTAFAAGNPPWEPVSDPPEVGALTFYNAAGQQITGGTTTAQPFAAYVQGANVIRAGDTTATLVGITPVNGQPVGSWSGEAFGGSPSFPNASAPASLGTSSLPLYTGSSSDESLTSYIADFPNNDTSTTDGYSGLYVVRLTTSGTGRSSTTSYDSADIQVTGSTWSVVYPTPTLTATTTTLSVSPTSPQVFGTSETLTATVSPSAPGTVQFESGGSDIGSPVTVSGGTASLSTTSLPQGTDSLSAVFTPAAFSAYSGSTGTASFTVSAPPAASTTTALSVNPSTAAADTAVTITADVSSSSTALASGTGQVSFYDNGTGTSGAVTSSSTLLGTSSVDAGGVATLSYGSFATGVHNLVAVFTPTNAAVYNTSTSLDVVFTATAPQFAPDAQTVEVSIPAGTLSVSTPYSPSNPLNLGTAVLDPTGSKFTASGDFGSASNPNQGVSITDTRAGDQSWTASVEASNFTDSTSDVINAQNLAFTGLTPSYISGNALQSPDVTVTNLGNTAIYPANGSGGLGTGDDGLGGTPHAFASATAGGGSVYIYGVLDLTAPSSTPTGEYTSTLTFTIS